MKTPSKELLNAALKNYSQRKGEVVTNVELDGNFLNIYYDGSTKQSIPHGWNCVNIYELMHLMKVWAIQEPRFIEIFSTPTVSGKGICCMVTEDFSLEEAAMHEGSYFYEDTEFEAVTQACEWILKQGSTE